MEGLVGYILVGGVCLIFGLAFGFAGGVLWLDRKLK